MLYASADSLSSLQPAQLSIFEAKLQLRPDRKLKVNFKWVPMTQPQIGYGGETHKQAHFYLTWLYLQPAPLWSGQRVAAD
jgi:hypothetical protein